MKLLATFSILLLCLGVGLGQAPDPSGWTVVFDPETVTIDMEKSEEIHLKLTNVQNWAEVQKVVVESDDATLCQVEPKMEFQLESNEWEGNFNVSGIFLGKTSVRLLVYGQGSETPVSLDTTTLSVIVIRENRWIDHMFTGTVIILVALIYINFGAAIQVDVIKKIVRRPVGPSIAFVCQFVGMPLLSYVLGLLLFPDSHVMQLGMFFTGVSPGGGASNIWTAILHGNIDLSITMTAISTFAAFGMMPAWIFTLGKVIFDKGEMTVPYDRIATFAVGLIVPLAVGILIQRYLPRLRNILVRILKPFSTLLIIFIVVFAIVTNLYIFELFSWQIIVGGLGLPWIGFIGGYIAAKLFRSDNPDALTIAVETGIQNTGIAIYLLRLSLPQPEADLTTVMPVAVAIMTPVPLTVLYIIQLIYRRWFRKDGQLMNVSDPAISHSDVMEPHHKDLAALEKQAN